MVRRMVCALTLTLSGCFNGILLKPTFDGGPVAENEVRPPCHWLCCDKVALIDVEGLIINERTSGLFSSGDNPVSLFRERLEAAACDKYVKAVVLRINSPGGAVTASDIMYHDLVAFREKTHKPVVACMMDVAASGGYYLAMGADRVFAHPSTVTGSIGVIMPLYNASKLFGMVGVKSEPIKSGPNKDIGNFARPMTEPERLILQGMVNGFYEQFVEVVARGRAHRLNPDEVRALADGRVYTGVEAYKLGLVDEVGYLEDAINAAQKMACLPDAAVVAYDSGCGYRGSIYAATGIPKDIKVKVDVPALNGLAALTGPGAAGFLYLWEPGVKR